MGIPVLDSDEVVHQLYANDAEIKAALEAEFGTTDRAAIGKIVFGTEALAKRKKLEAIIHPAVAREFSAWVKKQSSGPETVAANKASQNAPKILANLVPQLYEAELESRFDKILVVTCDPAMQLARLAKRNPELSAEALKKRIESQMPQSEKAARADYVIDNSGSPEELGFKLEQLTTKLLQG